MHPSPKTIRYKRVLGYARVSSEQQALGTSLKDQERAIAAGAQSIAGLRVAPENMHTEAASSLREKLEKRIEIRRLIDKVRTGDLIVVDKVDRWSRDPEFTYKTVREIREAGANVYFVGEGIDASTPDGDSQLNFRILFAREEAKRIRQRMVGTRKLLRDRGHYVEGRPPLGYRLPTEDEERHKLVIVDAEVPTVRQIFKLAIAGKGSQATSDAIGVPMQRIRSVLRSARLYLGLVQNSDGEWIRGKHEPLITQATFDRAHLAIASRDYKGKGGGSGRTASWLLRDVVRCAHCDGRMSTRQSGRGSGNGVGYRVDYYVCFRATPNYRAHARCREISRRTPNAWNRRPMALPCEPGRGNVRVHETHAHVEPLIKDRLLELRAELQALASRKRRVPEASEDEGATISAQLVRLSAKRTRLDDLAADGTMSKDSYKKQIAKLETEEIRLNDRARLIARPKPLATPAARLAFLDKVEKLLARWEGSPALTRRQIAARLIKRVAVAKGKAPTVTWYTLDELSADA